MSPQSFLCPYFSSFCAKNIFLLACNSLLYAVLIFIENCWAWGVRMTSVRCEDDKSEAQGW